MARPNLCVSVISHFCHNPISSSHAIQVISSGSSYEKMAGHSRAVRVGKHVQVLNTPSVKIEHQGGIVRCLKPYCSVFLPSPLGTSKCLLFWNSVRSGGRDDCHEPWRLRGVVRGWRGRPDAVHLSHHSPRAERGGVSSVRFRGLKILCRLTLLDVFCEFVYWWVLVGEGRLVM